VQISVCFAMKQPAAIVSLHFGHPLHLPQRHTFQPPPPRVTADVADATSHKQPGRRGLLVALKLGILLLHPCSVPSAPLDSHGLLVGGPLAGCIHQVVGRMKRASLHRDSTGRHPFAGFFRPLRAALIVSVAISRSSSRTVTPGMTTPRFSKARASTTLGLSGQSSVVMKV